MDRLIKALTLAVLLLFDTTQAALTECASTLTPAFPYPSVASGYAVRLVATGLSNPRHMRFDNGGHLLVVEKSKQITALTLKDDGGGCISVSSNKSVVTSTSLNHGIEICPYSQTLYASDPDKVYSYGYDAERIEVTTEATTLVTGMNNADHDTRTLLLSKQFPNMLIVNRGSESNLDYEAEDVTTGHAQARAFDITSATSPYDFAGSGTLLAWGTRNDVGIAEHPTTGGVYSVENSADQITRHGVDIHNTNPAEEMNFFGNVDGSGQALGRNFGYPDCYAAWDPTSIKDWSGTVGEQFPMSSLNDSLCTNRANPSVVIHLHNAPLDMVFNDAGTMSWITMHGSWDSTPAHGYALGQVQFANGEPVPPSTSKTAVKFIARPKNFSSCSSSNCWRPCGLAGIARDVSS